MKSRAVRVWDIRVNKSGKKKTYTVRWIVGGREKSRNFATRALADNFRSDLMQGDCSGLLSSRRGFRFQGAASTMG